MRSASLSPRQPEHPLGDDVALDLVRAGVDRAGEGELEALHPGAVDLGVRAEEAEGDLVHSHVHLRPEDLVQARLGADRLSVGEPRRGLEGVEAVALGVDPRLGDLVAKDWVAFAFAEETHEALGGVKKATGASQRETALGARRRHRDLPSLVPPAEDVAIGDEDVVEEDLGEAGIAVESRDRADGDAGGAEGDEEVGEAAVTLALRIGPEEAEDPVAERAARAPGLLPREFPYAPWRSPRLAFGADVPSGLGTLSPAREARQIAPRVRLGPPL